MDIPLCLPAQAESFASYIGAYFNSRERCWMIDLDNSNIDELASFVPRKYRPGLTQPPLTIELVPQTAFMKNVRSEVSEQDWETIKKLIYAEYGYRCGVCGGIGPRHPVEAHEVWHYDDHHKIQTLKTITALCPACHQVKHIGLAELNGHLEASINHLCNINQWNKAKAIHYIDEQFKIWNARSKYQWKLDLKFLDNLNIKTRRN